MNTEQAISELEQIKENFGFESVDLALAALRNQQERENPKPLTLEELKERVGKPVWVTHKDGSGARWGIVDVNVYGVCANVDADTAYWFDGFSQNIAYDHEPTV